MNKSFAIVLGVIVATVAIVVFTSTAFFARPLRLYDYGTPLLAGILTLIKMRLDIKARMNRSRTAL